MRSGWLLLVVALLLHCLHNLANFAVELFNCFMRALVVGFAEYFHARLQILLLCTLLQSVVIGVLYCFVAIWSSGVGCGVHLVFCLSACLLLRTLCSASASSSTKELELGFEHLLCLFQVQHVLVDVINFILPLLEFLFYLFLPFLQHCSIIFDQIDFEQIAIFQVDDECY